MATPERHAFIVHLEPAEAGLCRGSITHLPGEEQGCVRDLEDVAAFLAPYLASMGVPVRRRARLEVWQGGRHRWVK